MKIRCPLALILSFALLIGPSSITAQMAPPVPAPTPSPTENFKQTKAEFHREQSTQQQCQPANPNVCILKSTIDSRQKYRNYKNTYTGFKEFVTMTSTIDGILSTKKQKKAFSKKIGKARGKGILLTTFALDLMIETGFDSIEKNSTEAIDYQLNTTLSNIEFNDDVFREKFSEAKDFDSALSLLNEQSNLSVLLDRDIKNLNLDPQERSLYFHYAVKSLYETMNAAFKKNGNERKNLKAELEKKLKKKASKEEVKRSLKQLKSTINNEMAEMQANIKLDSEMSSLENTLDSYKFIDEQSEKYEQANNQRKKQEIINAVKKKAKEIKERNLIAQNSLRGAELTGNLFQIFGNEKQQEFGHDLATTSRAAHDIYNNLSNIIDKKPGLTDLTSLTNIAGAALGIISHFGSKNKKTPEQIIIEILADIQEQIENLRQEMLTEFRKNESHIHSLYIEMLDQFAKLRTDISRLKEVSQQINRNILENRRILHRLEGDLHESIREELRRDYVSYLEECAGDLDSSDPSGTMLEYYKNKNCPRILSEAGKIKSISFTGSTKDFSKLSSSSPLEEILSPLLASFDLTYSSPVIHPYWWREFSDTLVATSSFQKEAYENISEDGPFEGEIVNKSRKKRFVKAHQNASIDLADEAKSLLTKLAKLRQKNTIIGAFEDYKTSVTNLTSKLKVEPAAEQVKRLTKYKRSLKNTLERIRQKESDAYIEERFNQSGENKLRAKRLIHNIGNNSPKEVIKIIKAARDKDISKLIQTQKNLESLDASVLNADLASITSNLINSENIELKKEIIKRHRPVLPLTLCMENAIDYEYYTGFTKFNGPFAPEGLPMLPESLYLDKSYTGNNNVKLGVYSGNVNEFHLNQTLILDIEDFERMGLINFVLGDIAGLGEVSLCYTSQYYKVETPANSDYDFNSWLYNFQIFGYLTTKKLDQINDQTMIYNPSLRTMVMEYIHGHPGDKKITTENNVRLGHDIVDLRLKWYNHNDFYQRVSKVETSNWRSLFKPSFVPGKKYDSGLFNGIGHNQAPFHTNGFLAYVLKPGLDIFWRDTQGPRLKHHQDLLFGEETFAQVDQAYTRIMGLAYFGFYNDYSSNPVIRGPLFGNSRTEAALLSGPQAKELIKKLFDSSADAVKTAEFLSALEPSWFTPGIDKFQEDLIALGEEIDERLDQLGGEEKYIQEPYKPLADGLKNLKNNVLMLDAYRTYVEHVE